MKSMPFKRKRRRSARGALLFELLIAIVMFSWIAASLVSAFPVVQRGAIIAKQEAVAGHLANRMLEHLQMLSPRDLSLTTLKSLNLVDSTATEDAITFTNVPLDDASLYSPAKLLPNASGVLTVEELDHGSRRVLLTLQWDSPSGKRRTLQSGTVLGGYR